MDIIEYYHTDVGSVKPENNQPEQTWYFSLNPLESFYRPDNTARGLPAMIAHGLCSAWYGSGAWTRI